MNRSAHSTQEYAITVTYNNFQRKIIAQQCKYFMQLAWKASNY